MKRLGNDVSIITSERHSPVIYDKDALKTLLGSRHLKPGIYSDENGIEIHRLKVRAEIASLIWLKGLIREINAIKPDVLYIHGITTFSAIRCALYKSHFPNVTMIFQNYQIKTISTIETSLSRKGLVFPAYRLTFANLIAKRADLIIAIAKEAGEFAEVELAMPSEKIVICQHGADPSLFRRNEEERKRLREQFGYKEDDFVCIYTGKILPYKGIHLLLLAAIRLSKKGKRIKCIVIGGSDGRYVEKLRKTAKEFGFEENLTLLDAIPHRNLPAYYSASDVAVWPTSVTIASLEAMSCNLPIIVSDVPAAMERITFENGFSIRDGSIDELERYLDMLIENPGLREKMGSAGRRAIEDELNWTAVTKKILGQISKRKRSPAE